jgi:carboxylesterase type B
MLSQQSRPYFHRAISMSGVAFNYWSLHTAEQAKNYTQTLAKLVGCPTYDSNEAVECIRKKNPIKIVQQTQFFLVWIKKITNVLHYIDYR